MRKLLFFPIILFIISCAKNDDDIHDGRLQYRSPFDPTDYDGMLWFDDMTQMAKYYYYLDTLLSNPNVFDVDSMLSLVEANFDYVSLRQSIFVSSFPDADTARPIRICVSDELRQSIYNDDYCVRVGDSVYFKYSIDQVYFMHVNSTDLISIFRDAPNGGLEDTLPISLLFLGVNLISPTHALKICEPDDIVNPPIEPRTAPDLIANYSNAPCKPLEKRFDAEVRDFDEIIPSSLPFDYFIDFGDGNTESDLGTYGFTIPHTYAEFGTYFVTLHAETILGTTSYMWDEDWEVTIGEDDCLIVGERSGEKWTELGANGLRSKLWYANDILGQHFGCRSTSYRHLGGDWKKRNSSTIEAVLDGNWRYFEDCGIVIHVPETESKSNAQDARVSERIRGHCNFDPLKPGYFNCIAMLNGDLESDHLSNPYLGSGPLTYHWSAVFCQ